MVIILGPIRSLQNRKAFHGVLNTNYIRLMILRRMKYLRHKLMQGPTPRACLV
jgi:hypothetical protein